MPFSFEKLVAYQHAVLVAKTISKIVDAFPGDERFLADQLRRASASISLNIAEGNGRVTPRDRAQYFGVARGSAYECIPILELAEARGLIAPATRIELYRQLDEICRLVNGLIRATLQQQSTPAPRKPPTR